MKLTYEQKAWCEKHYKVVALLVEGSWRAVPITPTFEMLSAMADQEPEDGDDEECPDLMRWYAALAMVRQPEPDFWHKPGEPPIVLSGS